MHRTLGILGLISLTLLASAVIAAAQVEKPNVVFILADDLGYGDLGCYGHPYAKTPQFDSLAKSGTRFTRFYATGVTCQPSRERPQLIGHKPGDSFDITFKSSAVAIHRLSPDPKPVSWNTASMAQTG